MEADPPSTLIDLLRTFTVEVDRFVEVFTRAHGLHRTDLNAVAHIARANSEGSPLTAGELSARLSLSPAATTALLQRLERAGHVERAHDTADRRRVYLRMQPPAAQLARAFFAPLAANMRSGMAAYTDDELIRIQSFLEEMIEATRLTMKNGGAPEGDAAGEEEDQPGRP